ncbi:MAG: DUF58 domain-containing protein [Anaerolineae bacterium]
MDREPTVIRRLRPTGPLPFIAWGLLLFVQLISPANAWSWLLVGLTLLLAISFYWAWRLRRDVTLERRMTGAWVVAGDQLREDFTLVNESPLPVLWARVRDGSAVPGYRADRVESAAGHQQRRWTCAGVCQRRGVFRLGPTDLIMADPCGFFQVTHHYPATTTLMVYPRASYLPDLQLPRGRAPGRAATSERAAEDTITIGGLRPYLPGDSLRRIHWPATAHHDHLMVREFEREPTGDLWLVVDMDAAVQAGQAAEATQEYAVILAASIAAQYARGGERRAVGLLMSGRTPVMLSPAAGGEQFWRILHALAEAEPDGRQSLADLLSQAGPSLRSGRTIVVITPSQDGAWVAPLLPLMARGNAITAVLIDSASFDPPAGSAEGLFGLRSLLAQQRISSHVIARGFPFRPLERIRRRRRGLKTLAGFGRVVEIEVEEEV